MYAKKITSDVAVRGDGGVVGKGRVEVLPMFHSWDKCTMPLTNINSPSKPWPLNLGI